MQYILNQRYDETISINFIGSETIGNKSPYKKVLDLKTDVIKGVTQLLTLNDTVVPNDTYIQRKFRYKQCENWSELLDISELSGLTLNPYCKLELNVLYYFVDSGNLNAPATTISNVVIEGLYDIEKTDSVVTLTESNKPVILEPKDTYKIFKLEDFLISAKGLVDDNDIDIKYRITQDGGYTYTKWETLNKENISTSRKYLNELRFAKVQYLIQRTENSTTPIMIYDIMLVGDFQNVTANGLTTRLYGLREDCASKLTNTGSNLITNSDTNGLSCYSSASNKETLANLSNFNTTADGLWNPYKQAPEITNFHNFLANQTNSIFGWDVDYYKTDPDGNGIDYQLHEYGLYNVIKKDTLKVIVPDNQFPENQIQMNQFNLDLFDTFEIHILKDAFKNIFGVEERPAKNDIIYFCIANRLYYIKHSQVFKDVMHTGIYYKVILEKYETKANIDFKDKASKEAISTLTKNTTIDELFGFEKTQDEKKIANKDQQYPKSMDKIRLSIASRVSIVSEPVYNGEIDYIQYYYNFNKMIGQKAVEYKNADNVLELPDNRSFISWFKLNSYFDEDKGITNKTYDYYNVNPKTQYMLLDNYSTTNSLGYRYYFQNQKIYFIINNKSYVLDTPNVMTNVWYGVFINMNQRQNTLDIRLYKRMTDVTVTMFHPSSYERLDIDSMNTSGITEAILNGYKPVSNSEYGSTAVSNFVLVYQKTFNNIENQAFSHEVSVKLIGADMCYSNLRIFDDIIEEEHINNVMNQNIIKDAGKLIIADNANKKIYTTNIESKNFR